MDVQKILSMTDHTLLRVGCTKEEVTRACEDAVAFHCAAVCVPSCYISYAKKLVGGRNGVKVGAAVGFPNGYITPEMKEQETVEAKANGADEIDMVINVSYVKDRNWEEARREISLVRAASKGLILKVIIEACLLTDEEKVALCRLVTECKADYIKTSTGFSFGGATVHDVELLRKNVGGAVKVKAAGGIRTLEEAQRMIEAGASRIGASSLIKAAKD